MKLSQKLLLIVAIGSLITIIAISIFSFIFTRNALEDSFAQQQGQLAQITMDKIDRLLNERYNDMQTLAGDAIIETFLRGTDISQNPRAIRRIEELSVVSGPWDDIDVISNEGLILYSIDQQAIGKNVRNEPEITNIFTKALQGSVVYSDALMENKTKKPTIIFATPIRDGSDPSRKIVGVMIASLAWPAVSEALQLINGPTITLYNKQGLEIANTDDPSLLFKENNSSDPNVKAALGGNEKSSINISKDQKIETIGSAVPEKGFLSYKGNHWVLLVQQPTSIAFAPAINAALTSSGFLAPIIIISSGIVLLVLLHLLHPIEELTKVTKNIAAGDLSKRVPVHSQDELGILAQSFNTMADTIQKTNAGLEEKVKIKTIELSDKVHDLQAAKFTADSKNARDDAIIESIGDGMIVTDNSGKILLLNPVACVILQITRESAIRRFIFDAFQVYDDEEHIIPIGILSIMGAAKNQQQVTQTYLYIRPDKTRISLNITATPVIQNNEVIGIIVILRDITKEKAVDRMKTEFISLASHQLRTPLSAIKWFSEMLVGGDAGQLTDEQKDFVQNISDSTERMIELVNSLLNISRIESGRIVIDPKPTDVKELVTSIVKELQVKITLKAQNLIISVHDDLPKINLDPKLIRQVYMNLLTNAIKYTPKGGEISVFISKKDDDVISQVADNGYGIPKEQQNRIFQKFFRAENVSKLETDGTGLGLYLIKAIIESSHGKIWFESEQGKGTSFFFSLPMSGMTAKKGDVTLDE